MLRPAHIHSPAPGVEAQTADGHGLVLGLFGALGLDENGLTAVFVAGQLCQQRRTQTGGPVLRQDCKVVQLAHGAAHGVYHQQIGGQCIAVVDAPGVGGSGGFAVQDHAQGLELALGKIAAHLVEVHLRQLFGGQQPPDQGHGIHTMRVPFWTTA